MNRSNPHGLVATLSAQPPLRSSLRRCPTTTSPNSTSPRHVRFHSNLEDVRYFDSSGTVLSIDSGSGNPSPPQSRSRALKCADSSTTDGGQAQTPVRLKEIWRSANGSHLVGTVIVRDLAFEKIVMARFTTDSWQTVSEVSADYEASGFDDDKFTFTIDIDFPETKNMLLCVQYVVNGQEFWDNNNAQNYEVVIPKRSVNPYCRTDMAAGVVPSAHPSSSNTYCFSEENSQPPAEYIGDERERHLTKATQLVLERLGYRYNWERSFAAYRRSLPTVNSQNGIIPYRTGYFVGASSDQTSPRAVLGL